MKKNLCIALALSLGIGLANCSSDAKTASQEGVYSMVKASMTDGKTETTSSSSDGSFQYKIFTPSNYFYIASGSSRPCASHHQITLPTPLCR